MNSKLLPFYKISIELTVENGFIYNGQNLIIPEEVQTSILNELHRDHLGIDRTKQLSLPEVIVGQVCAKILQKGLRIAIYVWKINQNQERRITMTDSKKTYGMCTC